MLSLIGGGVYPLRRFGHHRPLGLSVVSHFSLQKKLPGGRCNEADGALAPIAIALPDGLAPVDGRKRGKRYA
jgi:hypothetical protein